MIKGLFILSLVAFGTKGAWSYSNFIGYGYASCLTCHYNAFGNGPLNDYGRALGANMVSGRTFIPKKVTDSELSEKSGFFGKVNHESPTFRPSIDYRGIQVNNRFGQSGNVSKYIHMALDANLVMRFNNDKLITSLTYGLVPKNSDDTDLLDITDMDKFDTYSREYYIMYAIKNNLRLYLGKSDLLFGIRVPDHIMFGRETIGVAQNDQVHGAFFHYYNSDWEYGAQFFLGDLDKPETERVEGGTLTAEYNYATDFRIGGSLLYGTTITTNRIIASAHTRLAFYKGGSLLFELGKYMDQGKDGAVIDRDDMYYWGQVMHKVFRGFHTLLTYEVYNQNLNNSEQSNHRVTFGFQWFPRSRIEIRSELSANRLFSEGSAEEDSWSFYNQLHLWF